MEPLLEGLLRILGGSEANFLEVCFGRIPSGNLHAKATSKKSRPPSGNFRPNPPELPRSPSRSFSSHKAGWKILLGGYFPERITEFLTEVFWGLCSVIWVEEFPNRNRFGIARHPLRNPPLLRTPRTLEETPAEALSGPLKLGCTRRGSYSAKGRVAAF